MKYIGMDYNVLCGAVRFHNGAVALAFLRGNDAMKATIVTRLDPGRIKPQRSCYNLPRTRRLLV